MTGRLVRIAGALGLTLLALAPLRAHAHGGGTPQITGAEAGAYLVYVWADPGAPHAGEVLHVTVGVTLPLEPGSELAVTDATVQVRFTDPGGVSTTIDATPGAVFYEADSQLPVAGDWTVTVIVNGAQGSGSFDIAVPVAGGANRGGLIMSVGLFAVVAAGVVIYFVNRRGRVRSARPSAGMASD